jgi:hypothetical protein
MYTRTLPPAATPPAPESFFSHPPLSPHHLLPTVLSLTLTDTHTHTHIHTHTHTHTHTELVPGGVLPSVVREVQVVARAGAAYPPVTP